MKSTLKLVGLPTSVDNKNVTIPERFLLWQNFPNPFNPTTTIQFALPRQLYVTLQLFDLLGQKVATLVNEEFRPGEYKVLASR
ncbi:MAG: hypothetical protein ACE5NG_12525 [bacterium]